jgi:hypothetical protein
MEEQAEARDRVVLEEPEVHVQDSHLLVELEVTEETMVRLVPLDKVEPEHTVVLLVLVEKPDLQSDSMEIRLHGLVETTEHKSKALWHK